MKANIRKASLQDLPAVHHLVRELAIYEKEEAAFTAALSVYEENFKQGVFDVIVAEMEGKVIGICIYYLTFSTWKGRMLYLEDFVVEEAYRRYGVGQLLFDVLLEEAKNLNCQLAKWQVLDWNEPAINFYKKNKAIIETNWWTAKIFLED